ncbi:MAG: SMI1/KNR4 family protein [Firmicutes bacterium]|nr:SMI1/KNR4 family protein [Candidatus Colivicinus equi]
MEKFIEFDLEQYEDLIHGNGADENSVSDAEEELGLKFCPEYKQYLNKYGLAIVNGHELSGLSSNKRTNVVELTKKCKDNSEFSKNKYVIEETNVDGIVIWQNSKGCIYSLINGKGTKIADSLSEYIDKY